MEGGVIEDEDCSGLPFEQESLFLPSIEPGGIAGSLEQERRQEFLLKIAADEAGALAFLALRKSNKRLPGGPQAKRRSVLDSNPISPASRRYKPLGFAAVALGRAFSDIVGVGLRAPGFRSSGRSFFSHHTHLFQRVADGIGRYLELLRPLFL